MTVFNIDSEMESDAENGPKDLNENILKTLTNKDIIKGQMYQIRNKKKLQTIA